MDKRFTIEYVQGNPTIFHIVENGEHIDEIKIVDLLNELSEENQHLNYDNKRMVKFIMSKGYGLKDYLDFCKEYKE